MTGNKYSVILTAALCVFWAGIIEACSVCRCGDNAFLFSERGFALPDQSINRRFSFDIGNLYLSKSNSLAGDEGNGTERQREIRPSVRMSYNLPENLSFSLEAPLQFRRSEISTADGSSFEKSSGMGDAELSSVWMLDIWNGNGQFYTGGLSLAVKLPTGRNDIREAGERLDEHLQAGTGTFDWLMGAAASRVTCASRYFTSLYFRHNGTNDFEYHYGDATLFNFGGQWPLEDWLSGSVQINGRYAARDLDSRLTVDNTGGWVTYITPGLRLNPLEFAAISAAIQIPAYQKLYGSQTEKAVLSTGLSIQF